MKKRRISILTAVLATLPANLNPCPSTAMVLQEESPRTGIEDTRLEVPETGNAVEQVLLRKDTEVKIVFAQSLSSKHATIDEKVELRIAENVMAGDSVAVPKGARVIGTVTMAKKNEKYGNSKNLAVRIDYIALKDKKILLTGVKEQNPKSNVGVATAATIGLGISGLMIYMNQRESWIHEGTQVVGYIAEDVVVQR